MTSHKLCQLIVKKYIKGQVNWPREIKIAQKLVKKFKSFEFWDNLKELGSPPPSLAWFLKSEGKAFLIKEYESFNMNFNKKALPSAFRNQANDGGGLPKFLRLSQKSKLLNLLTNL